MREKIHEYSCDYLTSDGDKKCNCDYKIKYEYKRCGAIVKELLSFDKRKCNKKAVLYLKDLSKKPVFSFSLKELYLCHSHANTILLQIMKIK